MSVDWNALHKDVWAMIFRDYLSLPDLQLSLQVCHTWKEIISSSYVGTKFMRAEGVSFVEEEAWIQTFFSRRVFIALDCSSSMSSGPEVWCYSVALQKVKEILLRYPYLSQTNKVIFVPFARYCVAFPVKSPDKIDKVLIDIEELVEAINDWGELFYFTLSRIRDLSRTIFHVFSDFDIPNNTSIEDDIINDFDETDFAPGSRLHLSRVGNAPSADRFLERLKDRMSVIHGEEPLAKKVKWVNRAIISIDHIPRRDLYTPLYEISRF